MTACVATHGSLEGLSAKVKAGVRLSHSPRDGYPRATTF